MGGPEMAPQAPPSAERSSLGLDRSGSQPDTAPGGQPAAASGGQAATTSGGQPDTGPGSQPGAGRAAASGHHDVVVISEVPRGVGEAELAGRERDTLVLTAEERRWARRRVTTTAGRALALALPTGSVLAPGAVLHVGTDWFVVVECAQEPCLAVTPASREEAL